MHSMNKLIKKHNNSISNLLTSPISLPKHNTKKITSKISTIIFYSQYNLRKIEKIAIFNNLKRKFKPSVTKLRKLNKRISNFIIISTTSSLKLRRTNSNWFKSTRSKSQNSLMKSTKWRINFRKWDNKPVKSMNSLMLN